MKLGNHWILSGHHNCLGRVMKARRSRPIQVLAARHPWSTALRMFAIIRRSNPGTSRLHRRCTNRAPEGRCVPLQYERAPAQHKHLSRRRHGARQQDSYAQRLRRRSSASAELLGHHPVSGTVSVRFASRGALSNRGTSRISFAAVSGEVVSESRPCRR